MGKLFMRAAGVMVTLEPEMLTAPVTSSIRSSWPVARLEFWRGRLKRLVTGRATVLAKFSVSVVPVREMALARLTSMPSPLLPEMLWEVVIVEVKGPEKAATQTVFAEHGWLRLVMVAPVPLKKLSVALEKVTATEL